MTFKPATWYPIAVALSVLNLVGVGFAVRPGEPWHATTHAALAVAFGLWAQRLRHRRGGNELEDRLDALEVEVSKMRLELNETQERLDFAERLLAQRPETHGLGPQR